MIPLHLRITGFLSYRDPVELDFTRFNVACISGQNGAGKSSLLDAITWALFGQARKRDDSLVNLQSKAAEVILTFGYEGDVYRVQRALPRGKTTVLEFQIHDPGLKAETSNIESANSSRDYRMPDDGAWRPLTERTLRDTQARIEETLRLDYETFVNAAFFLQGKADEFARQTPGKRKDVLSSILGLETWEVYRLRTSEKRKALDDEIFATRGRLDEIEAELAQEEPRRQRLKDRETELARLAAARKTQQAALENIRILAASLEQQRKLLETLEAALDRSRSQLSALETRLAERESVQSASVDLTRRAAEIETAYKAWQKAREDIEAWDKLASAFREHGQVRAPLAEKVAAEKARLAEEQRALLVEQAGMEDLAATIENLEAGNERSHVLLVEAEAKVARRLQVDKERSAAREKQAELKADNEALKADMDILKQRIDTLKSAEGAACPLCGQPLSAAHRKSTLSSLQAEGKEKGDRFRRNKTASEKLSAQIQALDYEISDLSGAERERIDHSSAVAQWTERLESVQAKSREWETHGRKRLKQVEKVLASGKVAPEAQKQLAKLDKELAQLGYDVAAHENARQAELQQRAADDDHRKLEAARAALAPLNDEIANLMSEIAIRRSEIKGQEGEVRSVRSGFELAQSQSPNVEEAERALFELQEQENRLNQEVGAARQNVDVLPGLRARKAELAACVEDLSSRIGRYKTLERAFGKDGVPALLIEQALPEIEAKANELLDRLSDGQMSVRFVTQAGFKDRKREDLKETLDIQISDSAGSRDYETYSGGEAFRVNFAVRLALSEVLARRKGARLQTLVIDEGFASQDVEGRQRLIEAINLVKNDFAKILVITHLEELKDAFPTRIEVEKTPQGSKVRVS